MGNWKEFQQCGTKINCLEITRSQYYFSFCYTNQSINLTNYFDNCFVNEKQEIDHKWCIKYVLKGISQMRQGFAKTCLEKLNGVGVVGWGWGAQTAFQDLCFTG